MANSRVMYITYARPYKDEDDEPPIIDVSPTLKEARKWVTKDDYTPGTLPCYRTERQPNGIYQEADEPEAWLP